MEEVIVVLVMQQLIQVVDQGEEQTIQLLVVMAVQV